jgi:hypothetical protein
LFTLGVTDYYALDDTHALQLTRQVIANLPYDKAHPFTSDYAGALLLLLGSVFCLITIN